MDQTPQALQSAEPDDAAQREDRQRMLSFMVMALGMFMALLDIQIVAASLSEIQAGLAATSDQVAFIQTAYLITEVIMIPLSGWLSRLLSTRWLFTLSAAGFTLASIGCGLSWNIESMVFFRTIQGFVGGAMVPTTFAAGFTLFTGEKQARIPAILGLAGTLAPALGPTLGGWITAHLDWRWLFFINLIPGLAITLLIPRRLHIDKPDMSLLRRIDYLGLASLALFLGGLQYTLEEGPRHGWFGDPGIRNLFIAAILAGVVFIGRSLSYASPIVELRLLAQRNFALACTLSFVFGAGMYGAIYLTPLYLGTVRGWDALDIGTTVFVVGIFQLFSTPSIVILSRRIGVRAQLSIGFGLFAASTWLLHGIGDQWGFWELLLPQALRGFASMFCIVPITNLALAQLGPADLKAGSGLVNVTRNLGGAIGLALINTQLFYERFERHVAAFAAQMRPVREVVDARLQSVQAALDSHFVDEARAALAARALLARLGAHEALALSFGDVFLLLSLSFIAAFVLIVAVRSSAAGSPQAHD
ncbi:MAG: DHA2 family efflux MFS transporter permease subunit [Pseudomonadota bacterium]|nr:DHA2 family efflux MFS transporter permease subunit [Pseudomonadota bacterium]